jgi:hypothetical protein
MTIGLQIAINILISVYYVSSSIVMDFYWRLIWLEPRLNLSNVWPYLNPKLMKEGIELSRLVTNQNELNLWLPDLFFLEATDINMVDQLIKLLPNGTIFWSRHIVAELSQNNMKFEKYPVDDQHFAMTMRSFSYGNQFVTLQFINDEAVVPGNTAGNQLWDYQGYKSMISLLNSSPTDTNRLYSTASIQLLFQRESRGIIYRLALPVMIFMIVVGASFWADEDKRIDITLQVLLLVCALYIVIGQCIPFVGYLTLMDDYIITIFVVLAFTVSIHFVIALFHRKTEKYPLDLFYAEILTFIFRLIWVPLSVGLFINFFRVDRSILLIVFVAISVYVIFYGQQKTHPIMESLKTSILKVEPKPKPRSSSPSLIATAFDVLSVMTLSVCCLLLASHEGRLDQSPCNR